MLRVVLFLAFAAANGLADAVRMVAVNHAAHSGRRVSDVVAVTFLLAVPALWVVAIVVGVTSGWQWSAAATLGVTISAAANTVMQPLLAWSARHGGMGRATSWLGLSPVLVAAAGPIVGDALPGPLGWAGVVAVTVGVIVCNWGRGNAERPGAATAAAAAAASCGVVAVLAERSAIATVPPALFAAVLITVLAPSLFMTSRVLARVDGAAPTRFGELIRTPVVLAAAAATAGVVTVGMAAVALGPAWVVLSMKRLALPLSTGAARVLDRRAGRGVEGRRTLIGSCVVVAGVAAVAVAT